MFFPTARGLLYLVYCIRHPLNPHNMFFFNVSQDANNDIYILLDTDVVGLGWLRFLHQSHTKLAKILLFVASSLLFSLSFTGFVTGLLVDSRREGVLFVHTGFFR
jgi:hypothetical protein